MKNHYRNAQNKDVSTALEPVKVKSTEKKVENEKDREFISKELVLK